MSKRRGFSLLSFAAGVAVAMVCAGAAAGAIVAGGFSARNRPGKLEARLAGWALRASVPQEQRALEAPIAPLPEYLVEAREHYADHCAGCHGNNGSGETMLGRGLNPAPPDLRLDATQRKTDGELYGIIQNGVRLSGMPGFGNPGNGDLETWKLVFFLRHLPALTAEEEVEMENANPITPAELKERQAEDAFLNGEADQPAKAKGKVR